MRNLSKVAMPRQGQVEVPCFIVPAASKVPLVGWGTRLGPWARLTFAAPADWLQL